MKFKAFKKGGVHPHDSKYTDSLEIVNANIPKLVRIPMAQHIGAPARVLVKVGDIVEEGQLIGEANGFISANAHTSVSGKVTAITKGNSLTAKGIEFVEIETGGSIKNWYKKKNKHAPLSTEQLLEKIKDAGVVGMGGATFPTHVKLMPPKDKKIKTLIVNGAECEPYLTIDHRLMLEKTESLIEGIKIVMKILSVEQTYIGIEDNTPDAIEIFSNALENDSSIEVAPLRTRYPQGGEKQLIQAVTGMDVPTGALPSEIGVVVLNVATIFAIYEAVIYDKPLIERGLTYTGEGIENPGNYKVRIGTPIQQIIDDYGIPEKRGTIISGGPMMGIEISDTTLPVIKGTGGVVVLSSKEDYEVKFRACIRCTACVQACPIGLQPFLLASLNDKTRVEEAIDNGMMDCIECGACSWVCPSTIPIVPLIRFGKGFWRRKQARKK